MRIRYSRTWFLLAGSSGLLAMGPAWSDEFSWQLSAGRSETDGIANLEVDTTSIEGLHYFDAVDEDLGPLSVTPFLQRSSRIGFSVQRVREEQAVAFAPPFGGPLPVCPFPQPLGFEIENEDIGVVVQHVGGDALPFSITGRVLDSDATVRVLSAPVISGPAPSPIGTVRLYSVAGELFPTDRIGVRIGLTDYDESPSLEEAYEISATWFFRLRIAAQLGASRTTIRVGQSVTTREEGAYLRVLGRF